MRLTKEQLSAIRETFLTYFSAGDTLWLFGSRTDDTKKGGDIDLYIETDQLNHGAVFSRKISFLSALKLKIGDQKIDVVIKNKSSTKTLLVHEEAQKTGILLVTKKTLLTTYIEVLDIHSKRLQGALKKTLPLIPMTAEKIVALDETDASFLEVVHSRFSKMQDDLGAKVFPLILQLSEEREAQTIIDKLNRLEKLGYLGDAIWWTTLRELRNDIIHDYENDYEALAENTNTLVVKAQELLDYWKQLKPKLERFTTEETLGTK